MLDSARRFIKCFSNAAHGVAYLFKSQSNARIELIIACIVIIIGVFFGISVAEWIIVLLCIALVLGLEGINTAIEILANKVEPNQNKEIGLIKDVAAAAVLITALFAAIIGIIIFAPRILALLW
jgi:diacylglycerol kinase (ATP)